MADLDCRSLAAELVNGGLRWSFGVPGGGPSLQLIHELVSLGARFITTGHETTAALMAGAVGRMTGAPSAAICIKGPGLMNLAPGLLANAYEGLPMLSIAEAYADSSGARRHKWLPHEKVIAGYAKGIGRYTAGERVVDRCWQLSTAEFPGPVHIELIAGSCAAPASTGGPGDDPSPIMDEVRRAQRPVAIVGSLSLRSSWRAHLSRLQIPIFTTPAAKGVLSEQSRFSCGVYTGDGKPATPERQLLPAADLVVAIGVRNGEVLNPTIAGARVIRLDSAAVRGSNVFPPDGAASVHYLSDAALNDVVVALSDAAWGDAAIQESKVLLRDKLRVLGWSPFEAFEVVSQTFPRAVHVLDTGNFTVIGEHVIQASSEQTVLGTPNGRYLGCGVGYALGACLANPDELTVLWIGDGGVHGFLGELRLAPSLHMNLLVVAMCDGYFGSIRGRALSQGLTLEPLTVSSENLGRTFEAMGFDTSRAGSADGLRSALGFATRGGHPRAILCNFDADTYCKAAEVLR